MSNCTTNITAVTSCFLVSIGSGIFLFETWKLLSKSPHSLSSHLQVQQSCTDPFCEDLQISAKKFCCYFQTRKVPQCWWNREARCVLFIQVTVTYQPIHIHCCVGWYNVPLWILYGLLLSSPSLIEKTEMPLCSQFLTSSYFLERCKMIG